MWKKIAISGAVAAAIVGAGTAALAASDTSSGSPSTPSTAATAGAAGGAHGQSGAAGKALRRGSVLHGSVVTKNPKTGDIVTHDASHGAVTAVSATSITVKPADNTTQTYVVTPTTKVRARSSGKGSPSTISAVKVGDNVVVLGTGTGPLTATAIVDVMK